MCGTSSVPLSLAACCILDTSSRDLQPPCLLCLQALEYLHTMQTSKVLPGNLGAREMHVQQTFTSHQQGLQELSNAMGQATR